jgi:hypothetical protein
MMKKFKPNNDEIDISDLIKIVWEGKWKIFIAMVISLISAFSYNEVNKSNNLISKTEFRPITSLEENKYLPLNNSNVFINLSDYQSSLSDDDKKNYRNKKNYSNNSMNETGSEFFSSPSQTLITRLELMRLYVELISNKKFFEEAIRKYNLLDISQYNDDQEYSVAIAKLASSIIISTKLNEDYPETSVGFIEFKYDNLKNWKDVLEYVHEKVNKKVKTNLLSRYTKLLSIMDEGRRFELEDISIKIDNMIKDADRTASDQITFLEEQSQIAKSLGIKETKADITISEQKNNEVDTMSLFYLRGYDAIDELIELIKNRTDENKRAFIIGLVDLEGEKRKLMQNKTIERAQFLIKASPLGQNNEFYAASMNILEIEFFYEYDNNATLKKTLILAMIIGLIIGICYVLISHELQFQKIPRKK